jgi:hypothetical protein
MIRIDVEMCREFQFIAPYDGKVEGRSHRQVRSDRRIHRYQRAFGGLRQAARSRYHAVDDRFAVFRFANLKVGRIGRGLDEIAGRVDVE